MTMLDEIIDLAVNNKEPIGNLLRKCLVLEQQIKNDKFRTWLNLELDGYKAPCDLPEYRTVRCISKGVFIGSGGAQINDQPLSLHVLDKEDREAIDPVKLVQPAASYDSRPNKDSDASIGWSPDLTAKYQKKFMSNFVLNRARHEIPGSTLVALVETVRNRILRFALELKDQVTESPTNEPPSADIIERSVVANIYGGNIVIATHAHNFTLVGQTNISTGNIDQLKAALEEFGVSNEGILQLEKCLKEDEATTPNSLGQKTMGWLKNVGVYLSKEGGRAALEFAKKAATKWLLQYYGLDV